MPNRLLVAVGFTLVFVVGASDVYSQQSVLQFAGNQILARDVGNAYTVDAINGQDLSRARGGINLPPGVRPMVANSSLTGVGAQQPKPFSNVQPRSTVSPYLNLFNEGINTGDNYNTLVRPMLNQQTRNQQFQQAGQQLQRQNQALNARMQSLIARPAFVPQGNANIFTTGHRTMYGNTMQYYPGRR